MYLSPSNPSTSHIKKGSERYVLAQENLSLHHSFPSGSFVAPESIA